MLTQKIFAFAQSGSEAILWLLIGLSIISIGMVFERFLILRRVRKDSEKNRRRICDVLQSNTFNDIEEMAKNRETLEGRAVAYGLRHIQNHGTNGLEEIFNTFSLTEKPGLEKYLNFLATLGSNAPFIGLLGTVLGIMRAINSIGENQGNMSTVIVGIADALVATAVGLVVAIPAVIAYNYYQKQVKAALQGIETVKELCIAYAKQLGGPRKGI